MPMSEPDLSFQEVEQVLAGRTKVMFHRFLLKDGKHDLCLELKGHGLKHAPVPLIQLKLSACVWSVAIPAARAIVALSRSGVAAAPFTEVRMANASLAPGTIDLWLRGGAEAGAFEGWAHAPEASESILKPPNPITSMELFRE
eukprot:CAMPEP_0170570694 /NCGR_PEP_ID=MMETSP0224-20130122/1254_1 /TAXON_ID=285029 /ORGANISM="Togula jolla, Strain CCCM 725" /LENGTH=142 /DNA_ID=CAMNT_0010893003 /DNA_START=214 /DNA_END=643 /DNA_ORIENTATION=+